MKSCGPQQMKVSCLISSFMLYDHSITFNLDFNSNHSSFSDNLLSDIMQIWFVL